jgi:hypothetical protein
MARSVTAFGYSQTALALPGLARQMGDAWPLLRQPIGPPYEAVTHVG